MSKTKKKELSEKRRTTHEELTDMVVEGFERLDNNILDKKPPKIVWMEGFEKKEDKSKIEYLKKLASTMNNAAKLIQDERDQLAELMVKKEELLEKMARQLRDNNNMLQEEIVKMNKQRQHFVNEMNQLKRKLAQYELEEKNKKIAERKAKIAAKKDNKED